jgi:hypothetical protein
MFQLKKFERKETLELLHTINNHLGDIIPEKHLEAIFDRTWDAFERDVREAILAVNQSPSSNSEPRKWLQVAGSGNVANPLSPEILEVCQILGRKLAQQNFGLVTGNWPLVDEEVTKAYCNERENLAKEKFTKHILRGDVDPEFRIGDRIFVPNVHMVWGRQALEIDAIILVAGEGGTLQTALWMSLAGKPVFPLAKTGGDAEKYFWACKEEPFKLNEKIHGVTKNDFEKLHDPLPEVIDSLIELLNKWAHHAGR